MTAGALPAVSAPTARRRTAARPGPTRVVQLANFAVSQLAWFAVVLGAAHGHPLGGTLCALAAIAWHLWVVPRPVPELRLVLLACVVGGAAESVVVALGHVAYPSGQPMADWPPYWIVALWGLFAITLNVNLRWLRGRAWLSAFVGAVAGPAAFSAGVRLGGAQFVHPGPALATLACLWALALPLLLWLSARFDGVTRQEVHHGH
nr:DUF2878 domain-containing protein [Variovorax boronicumulans]